MALRLPLLLGLVAALAPDAAAQSVLDRTPNLSGAWTGASGVIHFNFLHRFTTTDPPARKVSSSPTLLLAASLPRRTLVGFSYSSNSILAPAYPNEWELFGRFAPVTQGRGAPVDIGAQVGYNVAAEGLDGELSVARRMRRVRLLAAGRLLTDPIGEGTDAAVVAGAIVQFGRYIALSADAGTVTERRPGEKVAWGVGLQLAIPQSPHSVSLHLTNANNSTVQSASRGTDDTRFGFEFTIPVTLRRYFGGDRRPAPQPSPAAREAAPAAPRTAASDTVRATIADFTFQPGQVEVAAGTTIVWTNTGQLAHSVTASDKSFDSGLIEAGKIYAKRFDTPGTFPFHCTPHPFMRGTVVVR